MSWNSFFVIYAFFSVNFLSKNFVRVKNDKYQVWWGLSANLTQTVFCCGRICNFQKLSLWSCNYMRARWVKLNQIESNWVGWPTLWSLATRSSGCAPLWLCFDRIYEHKHQPSNIKWKLLPIEQIVKIKIMYLHQAWYTQLLQPNSDCHELHRQVIHVWYI